MTPRPATVLLTGSTGYVGTLVLARLLARPGVQVVCPIRARDDAHAGEHLDTVFGSLWSEPPAGLTARVRPVAFDLERPGPGLPLLDEVTHVLHCATSVRFDLSFKQARRANVATTAVVADLARRAPRLRRVVHVSTAYVAGTHRGRFLESDLDVLQEFRNSDEQTKFEAECLLRETAADLPLTIVRPSIVVGEAGSGWTTSFDFIYPMLRAYRRGLLRDLPATPNALVHVVSGDYVADGLVHILLDAVHAGRTFHLVAGAQAPTVAQWCELLAAATGLPPARISDGRADRGPFDTPADYLDVHARFDDRVARALLGPVGIAPTPPAAALRAALGYAEQADWGRTPLRREAVTAPVRELAS